MTIVVRPPAAPVAKTDTYQVAYETPLTIAAAGVLGNDTGTGITVTAHTTPAHGVLTQNANGSFTYTPAAEYSGPDSYTYTITDVLGRTSTTTVTITVGAAPKHTKKLIDPKPPNGSNGLPFTGAASRALSALAQLFIVAGAILAVVGPRRRRMKRVRPSV